VPRALALRSCPELNLSTPAECRRSRRIE
jgi:hypothetical protein